MSRVHVGARACGTCARRTLGQVVGADARAAGVHAGSGTSGRLAQKLRDGQEPAQRGFRQVLVHVHEDALALSGEQACLGRGATPGEEVHDER